MYAQAYYDIYVHFAIPYTLMDVLFNFLVLGLILVAAVVVI